MATIVIIGASRGIGLELARQYAAAGDRVIATGRDDAGVECLQQAGVHRVLMQPALGITTVCFKRKEKEPPCY